MTPDERDLVTDLFSRLKSADTGARDRDVEALIADLVSRHPGAAYVLAQTVLVQEQALKGASERIAELEKQAPARDAPSGGFLASAPRLGPWGDRRIEPAARPDAEPARSPFSYQPRASITLPRARCSDAQQCGPRSTSMTTCSTSRRVDAHGQRASRRGERDRRARSHLQLGSRSAAAAASARARWSCSAAPPRQPRAVSASPSPRPRTAA